MAYQVVINDAGVMKAQADFNMVERLESERRLITELPAY